MRHDGAVKKAEDRGIVQSDWRGMMRCGYRLKVYVIANDRERRRLSSMDEKRLAY